MASSAPIDFARAPIAAFAASALLALAASCAGGGQGGEPTPPPNARAVDVSMEDCVGSESCAFSPSEFEFETGETVRFRLAADSEFHTFTVSELGIDEMINARETRYLDVTFDRPGEYSLICIPHESLGMTGAIAVR